MKTKRKPTAIAINDAGERFVMARAIMNPLIVFADGLTIVQFGGEGEMYLKIQDAIDWVEKELTVCGKKERELLSGLLKGLIRVRDTPENEMNIQG